MGRRAVQGRASARGFSLVEVLVVITIIGVLIAASAGPVTEYVRNAQVRSRVEQLQSAFDQARLQAVRRNARVRITLLPPAVASDPPSYRIEELDVGRARAPLPPLVGSFEKTAMVDGPTLAALASGNNQLDFGADGRTRDPLSGAIGAVREFDVMGKGANCAEDRCYRVRVIASGLVSSCVIGIAEGQLGGCPRSRP